MDDKIIYALNASLPTESFHSDSEATCKNLYQQLQVGHKQREEAIKSCILDSANKVKVLKEERDANRDDITLDKKFKSEQRKVSKIKLQLI